MILPKYSFYSSFMTEKGVVKSWHKIRKKFLQNQMSVSVGFEPTRVAAADFESASLTTRT